VQQEAQQVREDSGAACSNGAALVRKFYYSVYLLYLVQKNKYWSSSASAGDESLEGEEMGTHELALSYWCIRP
jgi:hypothetical protein